MKKYGILIILGLLTTVFLGYSDEKSVLLGNSEEKLIPSFTSKTVDLEKGLAVNFIGPIGSISSVSIGTVELFSFDDYIEVSGIKIEVRNETEEVVIIKWGESAISTSSKSCVPFLDGMKYQDAGNPSATPDSIISPGGKILKEVHLSDTVTFSSMIKAWIIRGEEVKPGESIDFTLVLKMQKGNASPKYYTINIPAITCVPKK